MKHLIKLDFEIMNRSIWVETLDTDKDPDFIKKKSDMALQILVKNYYSIPNITPVDVSEKEHDTKKL